MAASAPCSDCGAPVFDDMREGRAICSGCGLAHGCLLVDTPEWRDFADKDTGARDTDGVRAGPMSFSEVVSIIDPILRDIDVLCANRSLPARVAAIAHDIANAWRETHQRFADSETFVYAAVVYASWVTDYMPQWPALLVNSAAKIEAIEKRMLAISACLIKARKHHLRIKTDAVDRMFNIVQTHLYDGLERKDYDAAVAKYTKYYGKPTPTIYGCIAIACAYTAEHTAEARSMATDFRFSTRTFDLVLKRCLNV